MTANQIVGEILKARAEKCLGYRLERVRGGHVWMQFDSFKKYLGQPYEWHSVPNYRPAPTPENVRALAAQMPRVNNEGD